MPAVAEVQFKAVNSQQVVTAFKSVGDAAATGTTKIQQNSSAIKSVGTGMKGAVSSVGALATSFATLSLSIVNTWRSYRDLEDTQIAVNTATIKLTNATQKLNDLKGKAKTLSTQESKGNTKNVLEKAKIKVAQDNLAKAEKEGKKTKNELRLMQAGLNDMIAEARKTNPEYEKTLREIKDQEDIVANSKLKLGEAQEAANDAVQDFYLSIAPTAIGVIGSMATVVGTLNAGFGGPGKGLIGGIGGLGLVLGAAGLAVVAYQKNWFGLRDAIGGVVDWIKSRFEIWQKTVSEVFGLITKGDWAGAFNKIKAAAAAFWVDLKKTVPFFGEVEKLVEKIRNGNWKGAFLQIWKAASDAWATIKKSIPFLGDVEKFITGIAQGKWSQVFDAIKSAYTTSGLKKVIDSILGENWITNVTTRLQSIPQIIKTSANLAKAEAEKGNWKGVGVAISSGIAEGLKASGGQDVIDIMLKTGIGPAAILQAWKDPKQRLYWYGIGQATVDGIGEAIGAVASFLDPYIAKFITAIFDPTTWTTLLAAASATVTDIGKAIISTLGSGISTATADPAAMITYWSDIGTSIWNGIVGWMEENSPETTAAIQKLVASFTTSFTNAGIDFQNMGRNLWNSIISGFKSGIEEAAKTPLFDFTAFGNKIKEAVKSPEWKKAGTIELIPKLDTKPMIEQGKEGADKISKLKPVIKPTADMQNAMSKWNQFVKRLENTKIRVPIVPYSTANIGGGGKKGYVPGYVGPHQHGYQGTVKRPTMFLVGEGGRPEDVTVRPRGSVQRGGAGGGGGGGGSTHITISFEPQEFAQFIRYRINENQSVVK